MIAIGIVTLTILAGNFLGLSPDRFTQISTPIFVLPNRPPGLKNLQTNRIVMRDGKPKLEKFRHRFISVRAFGSRKSSRR